MMTTIPSAMNPGITDRQRNNQRMAMPGHAVELVELDWAGYHTVENERRSQSWLP